MASKKNSIQVKSAPYTSPRANEIVIKNGAVAINPVDWVIPDMGGMAFSFIKYPVVLGSDTAGEVVEIGQGVTGFQVGDRVVGHALSVEEKHNNSPEGAFQMYTVLRAHMASRIPDTLSYERAAVLPLGLSTAACALFQKDQLALQYPSMTPKPTGKTLLVWGGSTSVGSNAIQLAVAAGYDVITTASPKNFDYVKKLGASQVFDYRSKTVVGDLIHAIKDKTVAGALSIGYGAVEACMDVLGQCKGNRFISMASYPIPEPRPERFVLVQIMFSVLSFTIASWFKCRARGIRTKYIFGTSLVNNGVGEAVYVDFLPKALAEGTYVAAPDPEVVGKGLEYIQTGFDLQRKGMCAKKVVVSL